MKQKKKQPAGFGNFPIFLSIITIKGEVIIMNWNMGVNLKNKEELEKRGLLCCVCGDWASKIRCHRCQTPYKTYHYLCDDCFYKVSPMFHDKYVKFRKNKSALDAKKEENKTEKKKENKLL